MTLYANLFIEKLQSLDPEATVLVDGNEEISAGRLLNESLRLARLLREKNVQRGDVVLIAVPPGPDFLRIIYANMLAGTVMAIVDPEMGRENYLAKVAQLAPRHAFADSRLAFLNEHPLLKYLVLRLKRSVPSFPRIPDCTLFTVGRKLPLFQRHCHVSIPVASPEPAPSLAAADPQDDLLITYTSGTLHEPKGVVHTCAGVDRSLGLLSELMRQHGNTTIATHLPHFMLLGINAGLRVHRWDNNLPPRQKLDFIERHGITTLFGPPSDYMPLIQHLSQHGRTFPACLRNIYLGSAPVYSAFLARLEAVSGPTGITCLYGMTENLMVCHQDGREKINYPCKGDLVGTPFPGVEITLAPDGEVCIHSDQRFKYYWKLDTAPGSHATGDLGDLDPSGKLVLTGRKKDMIIRRNFNLYPGLYEPTINKINGIREAALIGVYNPEKEDEVVILVVEAEKKLRPADIMKQLRSGPCSIDREALPDAIVFRELPRSGRQQKLDRNALRRDLSPAFARQT